MKPNTRLKLHKFIKKYGKLIFIVLITLIVIYAIDKIVDKLSVSKTPQTSATPNISVINSEKAPSKVQKTTENFVEEFIDYCNSGEYEKAYNLLSDDCKEDRFSTIQEFKDYVKVKFFKSRKYAIQNYSVHNDKYIYNVKLFDDIMATGLTNSDYKYIEEKIVAFYNEDGKLVYNIGGFIGKEYIQGVQENEYLKADIKERYVYYGYEIYKVKLTNRSENIVVIQDGNVEETEVLLDIGNDDKRENVNTNNIVLAPGESKQVSMSFNKFYDDGDDSNSIILNNIRIMNQYTGNEETAEQEINNAIDKLSMEIGIKVK